MSEKEVAFSEFIEWNVGRDLAALKGRTVPAKVALGELRESIRAALGRGVAEAAVREVLKTNGINLGEAAFRKLVKEGRPSGRMRVDDPEAAGSSLGGGEGEGDEEIDPGNREGEGPDPPGEPGRDEDEEAEPGQAASRQWRQAG